MADWLKIAIKIAVAVTIVGLIVVLLNVITVPAVDLTPITGMLSTVLAIVYHWVPIAQVLLPASFVILGVVLSILAVRYTISGLKWLLKINE